MEQQPVPMTIRARITAALHREPVDQIPFTIYPGMVPKGDQERRLRALGLGTNWRVPLATSHAPSVKTDYVEYEERRARFGRTTVTTPCGEVSSTQRLGAAYGSNWYVDHYVKQPEDYRVIAFMVEDTVYAPAYDAFHNAVEELGEDGYVTGNFGYSPFMEMRVNLLGMERFAMDQFDHPELFHSLLDALTRKQREAYPILADGPAELVIYCGNCVPEVLGNGFAQHCLPCYDELGEMLHARGKLLGCHLDANNLFWAQAVADSALDVIEAFTPAPDTDMSVADARAAWPDKVLWLNFPSSLHLASAERIKQETRQLLMDAAPALGVIVGITENIPQHAWERSLTAIAETLLEARKS